MWDIYRLVIWFPQVYMINWTVYTLISKFTLEWAIIILAMLLYVTIWNLVITVTNFILSMVDCTEQFFTIFS